MARAGGATGSATPGGAVLDTVSGNVQGGVATGPTIVKAFHDHAGISPMGWQWVYGDPSTRETPFEPHRSLAGLVFTSWTDEALAASPASWPPVAHYFPGDHLWCQCDAAPFMRDEGGPPGGEPEPGDWPYDDEEMRPYYDDPTEWAEHDVLGEINDETTEWARVLTDDEAAALRGYTGENAPTSTPVNRALRQLTAGEIDELPDSIAERVRLVDEAIAKAGHSEYSDVVWRGRTLPLDFDEDDLKRFLDLGDRELGDVFAERTHAAALRRFRPGDVIDLGGGYVSTSQNPAIASGAAASPGPITGRYRVRQPGVIYEIRTKRGAPLLQNLDLTAYPNEAEVLLPRGGRYRVRKVLAVEFDGGFDGEPWWRTVVQLDEVL